MLADPKQPFYARGSSWTDSYVSLRNGSLSIYPTYHEWQLLEEKEKIEIKELMLFKSDWEKIPLNKLGWAGPHARFPFH